VEKVGHGGVVTPVFVIITSDISNADPEQAVFAVGYGEFEDSDAQKTKLALADTIEYAIDRYQINSGF